MKQGEIVEIFENFVTEEKSEGKAKVLKVVNIDKGYHLDFDVYHLEVEFLSDKAEVIRFKKVAK